MNLARIYLRRSLDNVRAALLQVEDEAPRVRDRAEYAACLRRAANQAAAAVWLEPTEPPAPAPEPLSDWTPITPDDTPV